MFQCECGFTVFQDDLEYCPRCHKRLKEVLLEDVEPVVKPEPVVSTFKYSEDLIGLGCRLKQARQNLKLNQVALGKEFNVSNATISFWENGQISEDRVNFIKSWIAKVG